MSDVVLRIDGREVRAQAGDTVLNAARSAGIEVPTLCHHEKLAPFGACRLCIVAINGGGAGGPVPTARDGGGPEPTARDGGGVAAGPEPAGRDGGGVAAGPEPAGRDGGGVAGGPEPTARDGGGVAAGPEPAADVKLVVSCVTPVADGLEVLTRTPRIERFRKTLLELQLSHAPHAPKLLEMAQEYGAQPDRFTTESSFCVHCGLCVRYCAEVKGAHAVGFVDRGIRKEISFIPAIAAVECDRCKECFPLCPTSYLQAAFVLAQSLSFPKKGAG